MSDVGLLRRLAETVARPGQEGTALVVHRSPDTGLFGTGEARQLVGWRADTGEVVRTAAFGRGRHGRARYA